MDTLVVYREMQGGYVPVMPDPYDPQCYRDLLLARRFDDVPGCVRADAGSLCRISGQVFYSSMNVENPDEVHNFMIGNGDLYNGCWSPNPRDAVPEYVGVRFEEPMRVTGFQFSSTASISYNCFMSAAPCGYPTCFSLEGSNDEVEWTSLLAMTDFTGMCVTFTSPYYDEDSDWWDDGVFLSDRMDIADPQHFLSYRMVITAFKPNIKGFYNLSELVLYGDF